tara:strand:- start:1528 stop:1914 length:387 start_codon:yes stop_codon:yes gene_type:complete
MGMFTELVCNIQLTDKAESDNTIPVLKRMIGEHEGKVLLPDHALFLGDTWDYMLQCGSYYFQPQATTALWHEDISKSWYLSIRCDFKNYGGEAALFFDWIKAYTTDYYLGYTRYEEDREPNLQYNDEE